MNYNPSLIGEKIKFERKKRNWSQAKLGEKLGISNNQVSKYEKGDPAPPIEMLFTLCKIFNCELGYLLGENDYTEGNRLETEICNLIGLNHESIHALKMITGTHKRSPRFGYASEQYRRIINSIFCSDYIFHFIDCIADLDDCIQESERIDKEFEKLDEDVRKQCQIIYTSSDDYEHDPNYVMPDNIKEAIKLLSDTIDKQHDLIYPEKVARYELNAAFEGLISSIYPKDRYFKA